MAIPQHKSALSPHVSFGPEQRDPTLPLAGSGSGVGGAGGAGVVKHEKLAASNRY